MANVCGGTHAWGSFHQRDYSIYCVVPDRDKLRQRWCASASETLMTLQHTIKAVIRPGEQSGYVGECLEVPVVTQGASLDETVANLSEAVALHLEGEELDDLARVANVNLIVTGNAL